MARVPRHLVERLTQQHRVAQGRLLAVVAGQLAGRLSQLPDVSDESRDAYVAGAVPLIVAGQRRAATYAAAFARAIAPAVDPAGRLDLQLDELVVTAETAWVASPIIVARRELGAGSSWGAALELAATKAKGYTSGDLAVAQRHGITRGAASTGAELDGYRKVLAGGACAWCRDVSGGLYRSADSVPFHEHDACSVEPVYR